MLRNLLGIVGVSSLLVAVPLSAASAADMPLKAPAPSATYDWSGIYVGGNLGGGWARNDFSDPGLGIIGAFLGVPVEQTVNSSGFLGGFQAGTNYQIGKLVVGAEADADWADINGTSSATFGPFGVPFITRTLGAKTDWTATVTTRIGIAHDRWMIYGKAGAAWENTKYTDTWSTPVFGAVFSGSGSETRPGWTVGSGVEYAFWNNWSAKLEYDYMNFGSNTTTIGGVISPLVIPANFGVQNNQEISEVKFGINYKLMPNFW